ncbi:MAG: glycosyltransferase family 39 protein [Hyphomonas sp.]|uniref:ArnT family glycosyltransferase n=1 Tax=Hyphomonas sp. TaxID=87 RepID=UPI003526CD64
MAATPPDSQPDWQRITFMLLAILLAARVLLLVVTPLNLYADEAQYWRWGEHLAWGYYSKPPMIAWLIHAVTGLFGNAEWAIRLPAPFLHTAGAMLLFLLGRDMYGGRVGMLAALGYALMPAVILSSAVISTDGVLMPFWCLALYAFWRLRSGTGAWASAFALGLGIGCGLLSKYAMMYFLIGIALTLVLDRDSRKALISPKGLAALAIAALIFAPHVVWNAANDFKTVSHTVDNANLGGKLFNPENALTFFVDQLGVFGPVTFLALVFGLFVVRSQDHGLMGRDRWLLCFILPVLGFILFQAVLSRANANWTATAYPAASVLVAAWLTRARRNRNLWYAVAGFTFLALQFVPDVPVWGKLVGGAVVAGLLLAWALRMKFRPSGLLWFSIGLHGVLALSFAILSLLPLQTTTALGIDNALKRTRGWDQAAKEVFSIAEAAGATAVLVDEREAWHGLDYYGDGRAIPLISWRRYGVPKSFSETQPLEAPQDTRVLVASIHPGMRPRMRSEFDQFEPAGEVSIPLGRRPNGCPISRTFQLYIASGFHPEPHTAEWEARFEGQKEFAPAPCPARD